VVDVEGRGGGAARPTTDEGLEVCLVAVAGGGAVCATDGAEGHKVIGAGGRGGIAGG